MPEMRFTPPELWSYLAEDLLPLWHERGVDRERGGFYDRLTLALAPWPDPQKRLLTQARQLWVFSHVARLGGPEFCLSAARHGYQFLLKYRDPQRGGWYRTATADGEPADRRKDTYDHAFVLLALAEYGRATGETAPLEEAGETLELMQEHLWDPEAGGFFEAAEEDWTPQRGGRRQNPHMHLLEAALALHSATSEGVYLELARDLVSLFRQRFFDRRSGILAERFDAAWGRAQGEDGELVEPGHQFEWVWLLHAAAEADPSLQLEGAPQRLFRFAQTHGVDAETGGVYDAIDRDGRVLLETKRLWPQTEYVQARAARLRTGSGSGERQALRDALAHCFDRYARPEGGWHERLDREGRVISEELRASSVYHIVQALTEAGRGLQS